MSSDMNSFFREERKRVFEPGPFFVQKVMARLKSQPSIAELSIWDVIPSATRSVFALALTLLFAVLAVQILMPVEPARGPIEAYVTSDLSASETLLFTGAEVPTSAAQIEELFLEPGQ
jgi:hypothetical protein